MFILENYKEEIEKLWTDEETDILRKNYGHKTLDEICVLLGRTKSSVKNKITRLGLAQAGKKPWTPEDTRLLEDSYSDMTVSELQRIMDRSENDIRNTIRRLGLSKLDKWSGEEEVILRNNYLDRTTAEISLMLDRSESSVKGKITRMGLVGKNDQVTWSEEETETLKNLYFNTPNAEISEVLGRSESSVKGKIERLGLVGKNRPHKSHEQFEEEVGKISPDIKLLEKYTSSTTYIRVGSTKCDHEWQLHPKNFISGHIGSKCPQCMPGITKSPEVFAEEVRQKAPHLILLENYTRNDKYIRVRGAECGHEWEIHPSNFRSKGTGIECPVCTPKGVSKAEIALGNFLAQYTKVVRGSRNLLSGQEIDIFLPEFNLGIEYNGLHYHSERTRPERYHIEKTELAASKGIRLIHVFENEDMNIVKSRLLSIIGKSSYSLRAGKTEVREIDFPREFLNTNHIQGAGRATKTNLGLFFKDNLIAVMTFGKPRSNREHGHELVRFCSLLDIRIRGGAGKLLKYYTTKYKPESILSYSDKRWSTGELYKKLGFKYDRTTDSPNYFYTKSGRIIKRQSAQKNMLKELVPDFYDESLSEREIMNNAGWFRVYDCGHDIWVWTPPVTA